MAETMKLEIFRYHPEKDNEPTFQTYEVPFLEDWVILDAINYIKDEIDGTLSYRWSCQMGVCGSCGMMINGVPKLSCAVFLKDYYPDKIRVEPLTGFPVERDLIFQMDDFMTKLTEIQPYIIRNKDEEKPLDEGEYLQTPAELARFKPYSMCINCMLCYAACPVYALDSTFIGPAAIALGQRYNMDSRDHGRDARQELIASHEGIWECTFVGECSAVCPKDVDPAAAIQRAKVSSTIDWFKDVLIPWGKKK
ncbi:MAG TPA: succinate dehydrogenase/fumarate reductase iron-sulfur subunit [Candidatus Marinimicrobia bacterium]|nr:succinate dehydrogenase/fumarate reductase iron-sulfur subunit [Candidatus Neomarinimicrobiota bacterium]